MLTAKDIREVGFTKAIGGYKQDEVDNLLDTVEEDYLKFEEKISELNAKIVHLNAEIDSYKNSQSSLQNILIEAQKLADKTVNEAKEKAAIIINEAKLAADNAAGEAKNLLETFDVKFSEKKAAAESELEAKLSAAKAKLQAVEGATADAVKRQQALFDKTRIEVAGFKAEILELYKKQLELINQMPDCVAMDAARAAEAVSLCPEQEPDVTEFVTTPAPKAQPEQSEAPQFQDIVSETPKGFTFNDDLVGEEDGEDISAFSNGFFKTK